MKSYWQLDRYNQVAVKTADQKELILICYDEAIRSLRQGKECYLKNEFEEKARLFIRAQDFITELMVSLNLEAGGQIACNLKSIYQYVIDSIIRADLKKNFKLIDRLIAMLSELRSAWADIVFQPSAGVLPLQSYGQSGAARGFAV
jgi:flagellar secretion chaperone FliS